MDYQKIQLLQLSQKSEFSRVSIPLPSSKSESNRALVIDALTEGENKIKNLAEARDTQTMIRLLHTNPAVFDVLDAGTTMRFLTAFVAVTNQQKVMTGTPRMCERPIGILVDALRSLGTEIHYLGAEGYPPLAVKGLAEQLTNQIRIRGDVSSQYISALLMIAPVLPQGLELELEGKVGSRTYIEMTLQLMAQFGIAYSWEGATIKIERQAYQSTEFTVESDWSGASYWFSLLACADTGSFFLEGLKSTKSPRRCRHCEDHGEFGHSQYFSRRRIALGKENGQRFKKLGL